LSNLRLPWKNRVAQKFFTVLNILFTFRIFNNLRLPWKQNLPWTFSLYWIYFLLIRSLSNFALALKNKVALNSLYWIYFLHSGFLSNLCFPWKTDGDLKIFTVLNSLFIFRIFEQLVLALKTSCPGIFHCSSQGGRPLPPDPPPRTPMRVTTYCRVTMYCRVTYVARPNVRGRRSITIPRRSLVAEGWT